MTVFDDMLEAVCRLGTLARPVERGELFPTEGHISLVVAGSVALTVADTGMMTALAGPGDIVGAEALGEARSPFTGVWLTPGLVFQVRPQDLCGHGESYPLLRWLADCSRWSQVVLAQHAVCHAQHNITARTANLLSQMCLDSRGASLRITQQGLADLLGVQRTSICAAVDVLKARGLFKVRRGKIEVRDLAGLRACACGCGSRREFVGQEPESTARGIWRLDPVSRDDISRASIPARARAASKVISSREQAL